MLPSGTERKRRPLAWQSGEAERRPVSGTRFLKHHILSLSDNELVIMPECASMYGIICKTDAIQGHRRHRRRPGQWLSADTTFRAEATAGRGRIRGTIWICS